jgi:hypothetical protein
MMYRYPEAVSEMIPYQGMSSFVPKKIGEFSSKSEL